MNMRQILEKAARGHDTVEVGAARWPVPKSVAHLCTPEATLSTLHGLELGGDQRVVAPTRPRAAPTTAPNGCSRRLEIVADGTCRSANALNAWLKRSARFVRAG